jgi:glutamine amidotransferase-like uncharacterized protein
MSNEWRASASLLFTGLAALTLSVAGCNGPASDDLSANLGSTGWGGGSTSGNGSGSNGGGSGGGGSSTTAPPTYTTAVLLYSGTGVSSSDAQTTASILSSAGISYKAVTSADLNIMTAEQFGSYGMLLVPGGVAGTMSNSLTSQTLSLMHDMVTEQGRGYLGFCAGAFLAGDYGSWGLGLSSEAFDYYVAEYQGITTEMVDVSYVDGTVRQLVWYGGPKLDGFGKVLGKYSDGTIAVAQAEVGRGFVTLSAVHPEAPSSWRTSAMAAADTDGVAADQAYALSLIRSTLNRAPQPAF